MKYALVLNSMKYGNVENVSVVRLADERQALVDWYNEQLSPEPYKDGTWHKVFSKGSELEWFNPADRGLDVDNDYWGGIWTVADDTPIGASLTKARG